jgi:GH24 family phage-related lysozyme (muramidase)
MAKVEYTVDRVDGVWTVGLGEKRFGPYSTLEAATAAAMGAADKAEAQGYEAQVTINTPPMESGAA